MFLHKLIFKKLFEKIFTRIIRSSVFKDYQLDLANRIANISTQETAEYVLQKMEKVPWVETREDVHLFAMKHKKLEGLVCEFGVYKGDSINFLADFFNKTIHGFDSFEGLPETWNGYYQKGYFAIKGLPKVKNNVSLHKGLFEESIPEFINNTQNKDQIIEYLHIDSDLYSSAKIIFNLLEKKIVKGTIIVFDEYFNFQNWKKHEYKAFQEFIKRSNLSYRYLTYNRFNMQVAVIIE